MTVRRKETTLALAAVAAVTVLFFFPLMKGSTFTTVAVHERATYPWRGLSGPDPRPFPQSDQSDLSLPWHTFETRSLRHGIFPFWDGDSYAGGYPFFANGSSAVLYPPRLILEMTVDATTAHALFSVLHVFLAGVFMYALMKELGAGFAGSLFSSIAWMLSSFVIAWLHLEVVAPMAAFIPLDLLLVRRAFRLGTPRSAVLAGLTLGLTLMAGHIILLGIVWLAAVIYATAIAAGRAFKAQRSGDSRRGLAEIARLFAIVGISLGAAAVVLLPSVAIVSQTARDPFTYAELKKNFLATPHDFFYTLRAPPLPATLKSMHQMAFAGSVTAVFAAIGIFVRRPGGWLGRLMAAGVFTVAVGTPATWIAYHLIPGFKVFRPYSRLLIFWTFAVALLGGLGLDAVVRRLWHRRRPGGDGSEDGLGSDRRPVSRALAITIVVAALIATAYQLGRYGRDINPPFVDKKIASTKYLATPLIERTIAETGVAGAWPGRVLPLVVVRTDGTRPGPTLFAAHHLLFGLDSAGGYDSVVPRRTTALVRLLTGDDVTTILRSGLSAAYVPAFRSDRVRFDLLRKMGVTTIVATPRGKKPEVWSETWRPTGVRLIYDGPDGRLYRLLDTPLPGPWLVFRQETVPSEGDALHRFADPSFDERTTVILEQADPEGPGIGPPANERSIHSGSGRVISARRGVNSAEIVADTNAAAWLVLPDAWSPGWTAHVDGRSVPVVRVDYVRRAVRLAPGRSTVTLRYRPPLFGAGVAISMATVIMCVAMPTVARRLRLPRRRTASS